MNRYVLGALTLLTLLLPLAPSPSHAQSIRDAAFAISNWQLPEAKAALDALEATHRETPEWMIQKARYEFHSGNYTASLAWFDQAEANASPIIFGPYKPLRAQVAATADVVKGYKEFKSPNGYFVIRVEPGKDEVLIPYAFETLEAAYVELGEVFGHRPPPPVVVEIYPRASTLARVSGLTESEIKTSGTIALCSYNRLMFTSPKALVKGYTWRDTLSHEYAHLVITQRSKNSVPIWMHEGLAKYHERRWRGTGDKSHRMNPTSENRLAKATQANDLITFEQMHPSMAKLPSQEATALAFAEVYTVMEYIHNTQGLPAFAKLLTLMREKGNSEAAIAELMGTSFKGFQKDWTSYLKKRPSKTFDEEAVFVDKLEFADEANPSELLEIGQKEARNYIHLGELLQARERFGAAVREYEKARSLIGNHNPILQTRLGRSLIALGNHQRASQVLSKSLDYYPNYHTTHILLGEAFLQLKRLPEAEIHLTEALNTNPFNPHVHTLLANLYDQLNKPERAAQARKDAQLVQ